MQIGVAIARWERNELDELLRSWSEAQIAAVESDYGHLMENPIRVLEGWAEAFKEAGVIFWSVHAPFGGGYNLAHPETRYRRRAVEFHKVVMERARAVGAGVLIIHPATGARGEEERKRAWQWFQESLEELLPVAEEIGITLAVENMVDAAIGNDPAELSRFLVSFFTPHLRLCFDTGHAHIVGNVHLWLESVQETVATYHLADNDGTRDMHLQPGYGTVPWDLLSPTLLRADFPLIVEALPWRGASWKRFRREVEALLRGQVVKLAVEGHTLRAFCDRCGHLLVKGPDEKVYCDCRD